MFNKQIHFESKLMWKSYDPSLNGCHLFTLSRLVTSCHIRVSHILPYQCCSHLVLSGSLTSCPIRVSGLLTSCLIIFAHHALCPITYCWHLICQGCDTGDIFCLNFITSIINSLCTVLMFYFMTFELSLWYFLLWFQCDKHQPALVKLICEELKISPEQMMDFELCLADTQPAVCINLRLL